MDYMMDRGMLGLQEVIYDGCQEQAVDLDISLPDYCPDIQKILKCQVYPCITNRAIMNDQLTLEGNYTVKVFYLDSVGNTVRCCENSRPFSATITLKQAVDRARIKAWTRVEYINCRATSSRRLDIHGAFSLCARVTARSEYSVISSVNDADVEQQMDEVAFTQLETSAVQTFSVEEVLELPAGKPEAETILRSDATVNLQDFKIVANKIMLKGDVELKLLYNSSLDDTLLESMEYAIPFSQMIDVTGIEEDFRCDIRVSVVQTEIQIKNDYSGEKFFFDSQIKLCALLTAYSDSNLSIVTDSYSKSFELNIDYSQKNFERLEDLFSETTIQKNTISTDVEISKMIDAWSEMCTVEAVLQEGELCLRGKYNLCILALNASGTPMYLERVIDYEYKRPWKGEGPILCDAEGLVTGISYRISASELEIKVELRLTAAVFCQQACRFIENLTADENKPREQDSSAALSLYYAEKGERLWDIARAYCTSVAAIQHENEMEDDIVETRGMLLIPITMHC